MNNKVNQKIKNLINKGKDILDLEFENETSKSKYLSWRTECIIFLEKYFYTEAILRAHFPIHVSPMFSVGNVKLGIEKLEILSNDLLSNEITLSFKKTEKDIKASTKKITFKKSIMIIEFLLSIILAFILGMWFNDQSGNYEPIAIMLPLIIAIIHLVTGKFFNNY